MPTNLQRGSQDTIAANRTDIRPAGLPESDNRTERKLKALRKVTNSKQEEVTVSMLKPVGIEISNGAVSTDASTNNLVLAFKTARPDGATPRRPIRGQLAGRGVMRHGRLLAFGLPPPLPPCAMVS